MATSNNKRIEETATTALKAVLLRCPILESFIDSNDKTPSWDGTVFVYKNGSFKKADMLGRAPVQIKGTETVIVSDTASYSCQVSDIRNYYRDGGCIFFLVSVETSTGAANIYYANTKVTFYSEINFFDLSPHDKLWSCYMHACIRFIQGDFLTNASLRERFGLEEKSSASISRLIKDACGKELIKKLEDTAPRYTKYVPIWA